MIPNDLPRDAQAKSAPVHRRGVDGSPIEPVEDAVEIPGRDSRSIVDQIDAYVAITPLAADANEIGRASCRERV